MGWCKHPSDARHNPRLRRIEKKLGEGGYARAFKLFELIAERGGTDEDFQPQIELRNTRTDLHCLADEWGSSLDVAKKTLDIIVSMLLPATDAQLTANNARRIKAASVLEGAKGLTRCAADKILEVRDVLVIPDILTNAGGVVCHLSWSRRGM